MRLNPLMSVSFLPFALAVCGLVPLLLACDFVDSNERSSSFVEMTINGEPWRGTEYMTVLDRYDGIRLGVGAYVSGHYPRLESVSISMCDEIFEDRDDIVLPDHIDSFCHFFNRFTESDGDAIIVSYNMYDNYSMIFDRKDDEVWEGSFSMDYIVDPRRAAAAAPLRLRPDTLRVRDGRFRIVLSEVHAVIGD
jgi:hypothetical protein